MEVKNVLINSQFVEKYRPQKIEDVILPDRIKKLFINKNGQIELPSNYLFYGSAGVGKTTLARILFKDLDVKFIEGSVNNGVDTVREIRTWLNAPSRKGKFKGVIIDEFDRFSAEAQDALRNVAEQTHSFGRFILTANFIERIIDALKESRFEKVPFYFTDDEEQSLLRDIYKRIATICKIENVGITETAVIELVKVKYPDMRSIVRTLQTMSVSGKTITIDDIKSVPDDRQDLELYNMIINDFDVQKLYTFLGTNYFSKEREFFSAISTPFIDHLINNGKQDKIDKVAVIVHRYMYEYDKVVHKFISILACAFELSHAIK